MAPGKLSLGGADSLEKEMATHSSTLAWKTPWMEKPGGLQSMESQSLMWLSDFTFTFTNIKIFLLKIAIIKAIIQKTRKGKINILIVSH